MILSCKPQFEPPILAGTKIHSMRKDIHQRWKVGMVIHFATGARSKNYRQFHEDICTGKQKVGLYQGSRGIMVLIDSIMLKETCILELARNDGFTTVEDMMRFFIPVVPTAFHDMKQWTGRIIHWTDKRY